MSEFFRRLHYLLHRRRFDRELANDLEFHREMAAQAGAHFGNALLLREQAHEAWGWTWIDRLSQDLRYAARMLHKSPGFTIAAVLMLAIGIGVNVAAFGFFDLMFLRPLPVRDPGSLLQFERSAPGGLSDNFAYTEMEFYREHSRTLSAVLAWSSAGLSIEGEPQPVRASFVTAGFLSDLGAHAILGRILDPVRDEESGAAPVVVLSHAFWQRHFGGDPSIVGKTIRLNEKAATVIGVVASQFSGLSLDVPVLWAPINQQAYFLDAPKLLAEFSENGANVPMWGRLQPGVTPAVAAEELRSLAAELHQQHPHDVWEKQVFPTRPGGYAIAIRGEMYPVFAIVGALGLLILAAACGNLGSLLLARGVARQSEIAIRVSLGAGRLRLMRQLFTESLLLASAGAVTGLGLGYVVLRGLMVWAESPAWLDATPDGRIIAFAAAMGFAAAILFGLTPAFHGARQRHRATITRQFLVAAQIACNCVLLIVAGLLARALDRAMFAQQGFAYQQVISIDPGFHNYSPANARAYFGALERRLRGLPGIESVALVSNPPLGNRWTVIRADVAGRAVNLHFNNINPPFFQTMQIPILRGRNLVPGDTRAVIVSESLARIQWPGQDPLGKPFRDSTVIGIVGNARLVSPEDSDAVEVYQLAATDLLPSMVVLVRTAGPPEALLPLVASTARAIDIKLFPNVQLMKSAYRRKLQTAGYTALSVGLLGLIALLLACLGIVGLVSYTVAQRTREIGVRMALGARPAHILSIALRQFSRPFLAGVLAGLVGAAALSQILRRELYGVSNLDPIAYLAAIGVFVVAIVVAALLPARRALRVDPMRALRYE